jgi:hypothetical protein
MRAYRIAIVVFSVTFVTLGVALLARTAVEGGGVVGYLAGGLFVALGTGRLALARRAG